MSDKQNGKVPVIKSLFLSIVTIIIGAITAYHFMPSFTEASAIISVYNFCKIDDKKEMYSLSDLYNKPQIDVYFDNNNDSFIRVESIIIKTRRFTNLNKSDVTIIRDAGGLGNAEEPIYLKSKVSSVAGDKCTCEYNYELADYDADYYIELSANSGDKYHITLEPEQSGKYEIRIEIEYTYNGKRKRTKTESCEFVYLNESISEFYY